MDYYERWMDYHRQCDRCREDIPEGTGQQHDDYRYMICGDCHHYLNSELCTTCDSPIIPDGDSWVHETEHRWCTRPTYDVPGLWVGVIRRDRTADLIIGPFNGLRAGHAWARSMRVSCGFNPVADPSTIVDTHHIWVYGTKLDDYERPEPTPTTITRRTFRQRLMFWRNQHD